MSDYEVHINRRAYESLWESESDGEQFPFGEDIDSLDEIINEEMGKKRRKKRRRRSTD